MSKSQSDQKLRYKTQFLIFSSFFNFGRKNPENLWLINDHFFTLFVIFFGQLHENISQIRSSEGHFEVLSMFKS